MLKRRLRERDARCVAAGAGAAEVPRWRAVALSAVASGRMRERPGRSGLMARHAGGAHGPMRRDVARVAWCLAGVVASEARKPGVGGHVARGDRARRRDLHGPRREQARGRQRFERHRVPGGRVAFLASRRLPVLSVREPRVRPFYALRVAACAPAAWDDDVIAGEGRMRREMIPHLPERHELVGQSRARAWVDVTFDTCDPPAVTSGEPRAIVGRHLMARSTEPRLVGDVRHDKKRSDRHDRGDGHHPPEPSAGLHSRRQRYPFTGSLAGTNR